MYENLYGIMPAATTPFTKSGDLDETANRQQIRYLIESGVHGVVVGGSTGEGHTLTTDELRRTVATASEEAAGRIPVVAGIIVDSTREAVTKGRAVADLGVPALQVTPVHYLFRPDDDSMLEHFRAITEEVGLPVIIYNVVPWSYLSPEFLVRIMEDVPAVIGVKQSAGDLKLLSDLMISVPPGKRIFTAVDALLYPAFSLGAHGAVSAMLTAMPRTCVDLWDAVQEGNHSRALDIHRQLLVLWNALQAPNLPACVKYAQELQGCPGGYPRAPMPAASAEQRVRIRAALEAIKVRVQEVA